MEDTNKKVVKSGPQTNPLLKVKVVTDRFPQDSKGNIKVSTIHLPNASASSGFVSRGSDNTITLEDFKENPLRTLKKYPSLKKYTNATEKQIEEIGKLRLSEINSIQQQNN